MQVMLLLSGRICPRIKNGYVWKCTDIRVHYAYVGRMCLRLYWQNKYLNKISKPYYLILHLADRKYIIVLHAHVLVVHCLSTKYDCNPSYDIGADIALTRPQFHVYIMAVKTLLKLYYPRQDLYFFMHIYISGRPSFFVHVYSFNSNLNTNLIYVWLLRNMLCIEIEGLH